MGKFLVAILCVTLVAASYARSPVVVQLPNDLDASEKDVRDKTNDEKIMALATNEISNNDINLIDSDLSKAPAEIFKKAEGNNDASGTENGSTNQEQSNSPTVEEVNHSVTSGQGNSPNIVDQEGEKKKADKLREETIKEKKEADSMEGFQSDQSANDNNPSLKRSSFM